MEQWKEVEGTDGRLLVSDAGRIKSLLRDGRILKTTSDHKGYQRLRVTLDRRKLCYKVHRLVAKAFIPNPNEYPQVNHINGDKQDNRAVNLEWIRNIDNAHHAIRNGLWNSVYEGAALANAKKMKPVIGTDPDGNVKHFKSVSDAERFLGSRHISDVLKGKRPHVKGWSFSYERG